MKENFSKIRSFFKSNELHFWTLTKNYHSNNPLFLSQNTISDTLHYHIRNIRYCDKRHSNNP